jgi:hypothetical protein
MKVGDLVIYQWGATHDPKHPDLIGTVLDFPPALYEAPEVQQVKVLTQEGLIENWTMQFCEVINESR